MPDKRCPRCDSAECHSAGAYNGVVTAAVPFCAGPPVDWRGRALEAEAAFRAGELAAQAAVPMDGVQGHWQTRGYAHASRLLRAIEAEAATERLRQALTALLNAVEDSLDVQERPGGEAPWTRQDFAGYLADATTALAAAKGGETTGDCEGTTPCPECAGTGARECPQCRQDTPCEACDGEGRVGCDDCAEAALAAAKGGET